MMMTTRRLTMRTTLGFLFWFGATSTLAFIVPRTATMHVSSRNCGHSLYTATEGDNFLSYLKFEGREPSFDVLAKTREYTSQPGYISFDLKRIPEEYYDLKNYIFRGPVVGPINRKDLVETNMNFNLDQAFPDLHRQVFGFSVDPNNPYRVLFFERWTGTNSGVLKTAGISLPASGKKSISPVFPFSITWTPEGKITYESLGPAVDRFEGNTQGKVAVFGLLETVGLPFNGSPGSLFLIAVQKTLRKIPLPNQFFSKEEYIPSWWKSKARGADPNDM
jgi:hypothetical protein